jgi:hypothetical protein
MVTLATRKLALLRAALVVVPPPVRLFADVLRVLDQAGICRVPDESPVPAQPHRDLNVAETLQQQQQMRLLVLRHVGRADVGLECKTTVNNALAQDGLDVSPHLQNRIDGFAEEVIAGTVDIKFGVECHAGKTFKN